MNDIIPEGTEKWFEYHCDESPKSADYDLYLKSHQKVKVGGLESEPEFKEFTLAERVEQGTPLVYTIYFEDGTKGAAFEDELLDNKEDFERPDPPKA